MKQNNLHSSEEEDNTQIFNNGVDLKNIKKLFKTKRDKDIFNLTYKVFRESSVFGNLIFLNFILNISKPENIDLYNKFLELKGIGKKTIDKVIELVENNIEEVLINKNNVIKKDKNDVFYVQKVRKLQNNSFVIDIKKEGVKNRVGWLSFKEIDKNIYYIDGFSVDNKRLGLGEKLMNGFKGFLGENGMGFLNDNTDNYRIKSPYEKYGWNEEKFISELIKRKVMYYGNNTKEKKVKLKQVAKNFYKIK